jgi:ankyrin repeat protein
LLLAAYYNDADAIAALLEKCTDTDTRNADIWTVLMRAARYNSNPEVITVLLKGGADIRARDKDGSTALMVAAQNDNPEVVTALLEAGTDVNA